MFLYIICIYVFPEILLLYYYAHNLINIHIYIYDLCYFLHLNAMYIFFLATSLRFLFFFHIYVVEIYISSSDILQDLYLHIISHDTF